jgi:PAS domain S-box-containing protein
MHDLQYDSPTRGRFSHGRFSRRLILMFIGCALAPILILAAIAYTSVSRELISQSHRNIGRAAKVHAIAIYDRLLSLQNQLQLVGLSLVVAKGHQPTATLAPLSPSLREHFVTIALLHEGGRLDLLEETGADALAVPVLLTGMEDPGRVSLSIRKQGELAPPQVIMSIMLDTASGASSARLEAEVEPAFLWGLGHANILPPQTDLVVIDEDQETLINTSDLDILTLKAQIRRVDHNRNRGYRYTEADVDYHVSTWPLFLTPSFGLGTWRVSYLQADAVVLAPIHAFKRSFLLILLLTFWVVLLLSLRYIRRAVVPLRRLHAGTRQLLEGNYRHHIRVDTRDEFAQVTTTFNQMTERIGRQVRGLRAMADIGRETAAVFGVRALVKIEMDLMARCLDFTNGLVLLYTPDKKGLYCAGHYGYTPRQQAALSRLRLDMAPHSLATHPDLAAWFNDAGSSPAPAENGSILQAGLATLIETDTQAMAWTPIAYEKTAMGLLGVHRPPPQSAQADHDNDLLRGIAAQTAVALHSALAFKQLKRSEARFRDIFAAAASGMALLTRQGDFRMVNQRLVAITGYPAKSLSQRTLTSLLGDPADAARLNAALENLSKTRTALVMEEFGFRRADGAMLWGLLSVSAHYGGESEAGHFIAQLMDLTEQKAAQAEKQALAEQLQHAQKMEAIGTLAGGIAHDFNNILGGIMGFAQLGCLTVKDESAVEKFAKIMTASERAQELVQQILTFSRQNEQSRQPIRIDLILKEALKLLRASIPAHVEIRRYVPVIETCVLANATQIHQVIMNLCTNAYHAMEKQGGELSVRLGHLTPVSGAADIPADLWGVGCLEMIIADTGCGMEGDTLKRIFDPYFTTKSQGKGTGLGLSVVHGIVESHGGNIRVDSIPGRGTTFRLLFPEVAAEARVSDEAAVLGTGSGEHVFLVDDEAIILDMGTELLTTLGYTVTTTQDPQAALENIRRDPYKVDLVITDLAMPALKGDDLARALHEIRADLPVVLCTGFNDPEQKCPDADRLFKGLLLKPFNAGDLQKAIQAALTARP